jgi:hypothetical protein
LKKDQAPVTLPVDFEVFPVMTSAEAKVAVAPRP